MVEVVVLNKLLIRAGVCHLQPANGVGTCVCVCVWHMCTCVCVCVCVCVAYVHMCVCVCVAYVHMCVWGECVCVGNNEWTRGKHNLQVMWGKKKSGNFLCLVAYSKERHPESSKEVSKHSSEWICFVRIFVHLSVPLPS